MSKSFKGNYSEISNIINIESTKWQRSKPKLIVVSKKRTITDIQNFIAETNHKIFAENYVQEAESKYIDLKNEHQDITVHLIGHLQSNKAKNAVKLFDMIETVDSFKLAKTLDKTEAILGLRRDYLIQVNIGKESQKSGVLPEDLASLVSEIKTNLSINLIGLMCVPPKDKNPSIYFAMLKKLATDNGLKYLSIGMSSDFKEAIAVGTNEIRIGTALFSL
ncbi:YggS family pyridoxal phosphate-dependent enzyme [Rickettsiales bacterium]|nr:YggS family pyridoxal phosphate-dependent enzyme [Rickettsiales bacterium]